MSLEDITPQDICKVNITLNLTISIAHHNEFLAGLEFPILI
jgi:hypothetical protein